MNFEGLAVATVLHQTRFRVSGMDCASCAAKIDTAVRRLPGVEDVGVSVAAGTMTVTHGEDLTGEAIARQVRNLGYGAAAADSDSGKRSEGTTCAHSHAHEHSEHNHEHHHGDELHSHAHESAGDQPWWRTQKALLSFACGTALAVAYLAGLAFPAIERWAFLLALAVGLIPIARRAVVAARFGTPFSIEMLMTIAAVGAVIIDATEEAAAVVLLFLIGEMLEGVAAGRARQSIQGLTNLVPRTALLEQDGETMAVPAEGLTVGSIIMVRPGDRIAADGVIVEGLSEIDEAPVTGESVPKRKGGGDIVFAGTINTDGVLRIKVTAAAADNTIARVVRLVEEAQESKAPTERFIDRFSRFYTPGVLVVAAITAILPPLLFGAVWEEWIYKGLAILLIGCPCALVISTPAAIAAGLSAGARRGLLMKGGAALEGLGKITVVALDKTGTLTEGRPSVTAVIPGKRSHQDVLSLAAALEQGSSHPLAIAILQKAKAEGVPIPPASDSEAIAGEGVLGSVGGERVFLGSPQAASKRAAISQEQQETISEFNRQGKTVSVALVDDTIAGFPARMPKMAWRF